MDTLQLNLNLRRRYKLIALFLCFVYGGILVAPLIAQRVNDGVRLNGSGAINGVTFPPGPYAVGDILYANTTTTLARLPIGTQGRPLTVSAGLIPSWTDAIAMTAGILASGGSFNAIGGAGYTGDASAFYSIASRGYWDASIAVNVWALNNAASSAKAVFP